MNEEDLEPVWRALADPTRRAILDELRAQPLNTGALCEKFDMTRHGVIKHLKLLESAGLVRVEAKGRERINHLNPVPLQEIYERWLKPYEVEWATGLHRLAKTAADRELQAAEAPEKKSTKKPRKQTQGKSP